MTANNATNTLRCYACGEEGAHWFNAYVGGRGYIPLLECQDKTACMKRQDAQMGWEAPEPSPMEATETGLRAHLQIIL